MTQTKHTPAPWMHEYDETSKGYWHIYGNNGDILVCSMQDNKSVMGNNKDPKPKTCQANARLIAAAPELLEALKMMVKLVNRTSLEVMPEVKIACEAIAKAEGKQ